ncbi:hypothetical protein IGS68_30760 (plasmid) [Skermanella sp. TT6]|uniref:NADH:quinone oxidoreductase/Mrp antiporter transmembrane domain-containing protein n=1 Tax=Skermanella cutis TaxID=2775420 RepID=A0ABX7BGC3_9PROT|nr:complex I subunit 5 family protein [Skermanella sp. TT6]QQP92825.1 hypothetical protein IGS68_30760 [Skermanella sp. TT6]
MTLWTGPLFPFLVLVWPLLLAGIAVLPVSRATTLRVLPIAPLPALWLALDPLSETTMLPGLLLGVSLGLDPGRALLLAMTAALWVLAGLAAQRMAGDRRIGVFAGLWGLTLAGNLGVLLAQDIATFYVSFAAVSLAGWALVVHDRSAAALAAGRVYIVMAVLGEVALLAGLLLGANAAAQSLLVADLRAALAWAPEAPLAIALLIVGFGIKAGLVPLHLWLPLAHPAAPVPASAVLSGAIVKAGLVGMIVFLPEGAMGQLLVVLGLAGAFGGAIWGLTQSNPKAILAYSTVSQIGLMILLIGAGGAARELVPFYALHHGLAKGALFLLVGVMYLSWKPVHHWLVLGAAALCAASLAGVPLSGGALTKAAVKAALPAELALALTLSSVTTTLVMGWFLWRLWHTKPAAQPARFWSASFALPALAGLGAYAAPWLLWDRWTGKAPGYPLSAPAIADGVLPIAVALPVLAWLLWRPLPQVPPGDLLALRNRLAMPRVRLPPVPALARPKRPIAVRVAAGLAALEALLTQWQIGGAILLAAVIGLNAVLG